MFSSRRSALNGWVVSPFCPIQKMNPTKLPSRLSERSFRHYELIIARAIEAFPNITVVDPDGSPITYSARLRDAMLSLATYNWPTAVVNTEKFHAIYNVDLKKRLIHVSHRGSQIFIGSDTIPDDDVIPQPAVEVKPLATTQYPPAVRPLTLVADDMQIVLICQMASQRLLSAPVTVRDLTEARARELEMEYDVRIDKNPDGTYTII